jgi:MYXO-CTERM domain-containing protein
MFNKLRLLLAGACLIGMTMCSSANAAVLTANFTATDDLSVKTINGQVINASYDYTTTVGGSTKNVSYLKFDLSSLAGAQILSVKLQMFGSIDILSDIPLNMIGVISQADDNWDESSVVLPAYNGANLLNLMPHPTATPHIDTYYLWNLFPSSNPTAAINILDNNYISLVIKELGQYPADMMSKTIFRSSEDSVAAYRPQLIVDYVPTPEPSSLILGLMSLGGILGIRRRK